jgi:hypothetical protein
MAGRISAGNEIELPTSRQDIADYLGLTIETVSRAITQLENDLAAELAAHRAAQSRALLFWTVRVASKFHQIPFPIPRLLSAVIPSADF